MIYSLWEGYKKEDSTRKLLEFLANRGVKIQSLHTSGHADVKTLQRVVQEIKPLRIIPIHTFHPKKYQELFGERALTLADGEALNL
jgi:ribonuclease J